MALLVFPEFICEFEMIQMKARFLKKFAILMLKLLCQTYKRCYAKVLMVFYLVGSKVACYLYR